MPEASWAIVLMAALRREVRPFLRLAKARRCPGGSPPCWHFSLQHASGLVVVTGMGAKAAREAGASLLEKFTPQALVAVGFGGALAPGLPAGWVVAGHSFWDFEPHSGNLSQVPTPNFFLTRRR